MRRLRLISLLTLIATAILADAAIGCNDATSPDNALAQLNENRAKWAANGYATYTFTLRQYCFCAITEPVTVFVDGGSVVGAATVSTHAAVDTRYVQSINALFDFIERSINGHADVLRVTYDPVLGYPAEIVYDQSINAADDEGTITAENVERGANVHLIRAGSRLR